MLKEAIILAGGLGTRLRSVVRELPKSMAIINKKPFLEYLLDYLIDNEISRFIFSVGYKSTFIDDHFGKQYKGCELAYAFEKEPLGTGGAIKNSMNLVNGNAVLIANGDSLFMVDIQKQFRFHTKNKSDATLALKPLKNIRRYGTVEVDNNYKITGFQEKEHKDRGFINGGIYIFSVNAFNKTDLPEKFSIEKDFFQSHTSRLNFYGYISEGYFLDIGIPEDFNRAQHEFKRFTY